MLESGLIVVMVLGWNCPEFGVTKVVMFPRATFTVLKAGSAAAEGEERKSVPLSAKKPAPSTTTATAAMIAIFKGLFISLSLPG
jgi:hypothetical protein